MSRRTRSLSLSSSYPIQISSHPPPPSSRNPRMTRYSPYSPSRLAFCQSTFGTQSDDGSQSNPAKGRRDSDKTLLGDTEELMDGELSDVESEGSTIVMGGSMSTPKKEFKNVFNTTSTSPLSQHLSQLNIHRHSSPSPTSTPNALRPKTGGKKSSHRRTQSLCNPTYAYLLLPQSNSRSPSPALTSRNPTPRPIFSTNPGQIPNPTISSPITEGSPAPVSSLPLSTIPANSVQTSPDSQGKTFRRMMLVRPDIAAHLKRGGSVTMRTVDGQRKWRIRLPEQVKAKMVGLGIKDSNNVVMA